MFSAEVFVGIVIYLELEHSRFTSFLEKATAKNADQERRDLYAAYLNLPGTPEEKTEEFHRWIYRDSFAGKALKLKCDNQIALFSEMDFASNRWFSLPFRENRFVALFPHAPVYMWRIIGPYLRDRREATGPWFAQKALIFIKQCTEYVLGHTEELKLKRPDGSNGLTITRAEMEEMRRELGKLIAEEKSAYRRKIKPGSRRNPEHRDLPA
jgi:hypothetical protein